MIETAEKWKPAKKPKNVVIIEKMNEEVENVCANLKHEPIIIEFEAYVREDAPTIFAHLFNPLYEVKVVKPEKDERKPLLEQYKIWKSMFKLVDPNVREIVNELTNSVLQLPNIIVEEHGRYKCFYKGKSNIKSIFAAFLLTKEALKFRIRTDPTTFRDE